MLKSTVTIIGRNLKKLTQNILFQQQWISYPKRYAQQVINEVKENYKECFEKFIPIEKWDEATEFLSTDNGGLPKDFLTRNVS